MGFFKRLFGVTTTKDERPPRKTVELAPRKAPRSGPSRSGDAYFDTLMQLQNEISKREYEKAGQSVRQNLDHLPGWVKEYRREFGSFKISSIPALEQGGTVLALLGDDTELDRMHEIVTSVPELQPWVEGVARHRDDRRLFQEISRVVVAHPNCLQTAVKKLVGEADGRRVANLISYLEKSGRIARVKTGRTYRLLASDSPDVPAPSPKRVVRSHRNNKKSPRLRELKISSLDYVPLPRSPHKWEEAVVIRESATVPKPSGYFEVGDADWQIKTIEKIPMAERPDTAFRKMHPTDSGIVIIDDLGKAQGLGQIEAAALRYDRGGELAAKKGLQHGVYRVGVHPLGRGLIAMSRDGVVHAYSDEFELILETALTESPEIRTLKKRFDVRDDQVKNHIRCVALSRNASRYLFTTVDEAWCIGLDGTGIWGAKLPPKEGWTQVSTPSDGSATRSEVDRSLALMGLSLPVTPEELKGRYRALAKRWHQDLNPEDSQAHTKMKSLNAAMEVLTGVDTSALPRYTGATFVRVVDRTEFEVHGMTITASMTMQAGEFHVADWIYAADFAANADSVYLAGYSGRVILVDENGNGIRVYDIGNVPRRIVDTGDYLYLLTDTRLYVLRENALHALVDTYEGGELFVAQTGFGLLEKNRLRWFREDGHYLGSVVSKKPIRRVYSTDQGMVVESSDDSRCPKLVGVNADSAASTPLRMLE